MPSDDRVLEAIDDKVRRAEEHLAAFRQQSRDYLKATKHDHGLIFDQKQHRLILTFTLAQPPPVRLSILAGDCVHNARSALDNLVCGLARIEDPKCECGGRKYPMYTDVVEYEKRRDKILKGVPEPARVVIDGHQPTTRMDGSASQHPLAILNRLSNRDKHRAPQLASAYARNVHLEIWDSSRNGWQQCQLKSPVFADRFTVLPYVPFTPQDGARVKVKGESFITFADNEIAKGRPAEDVLRRAVDFIKLYVVPRLRPFFSPQSTPPETP